MLELTIAAHKDLFPLSATLFEAKVNDSDVKSVVVLINAAVIQAIYVVKYSRPAYAAYLADKGLHVLTYDYRGIGRSMADLKLKDIEASSKDHYATRDQPAMIEYINRNWPDKELVIVGHSLGAHIVPLCPEPYQSMISRCLFISANNAFWMYSKILPVHFFFSHFYIPFTTKMYGYCPTTAVNVCEDLPDQVANNWATWMRNYNYYNSDSDIIKLTKVFKKQVLSICFVDDDFSYPLAFESFLKLFPNANASLFITQPLKNPVGHNGYFTSAGKELWGIPLPFLLNSKTDLNFPKDYKTQLKKYPQSKL